MHELPPNDEALWQEAWVVHDGFELLSQLGCTYDQALSVATDPELVESSLSVEGNLQTKCAAMVANVLQHPIMEEVQLRLRGNNVERPISAFSEELYAKMQVPGHSQRIVEVMDDFADRCKNV